MKKKLIQIASLFSVIFLAFSPLVAAQDTSVDFSRYNMYSWGVNDFHSDIDIHKDSSITVAETIVADFTKASSRHGIYRYIPIHYKDRYNQDLNLRFNLISVTDENNKDMTADVTYDGPNVDIKIGDPDVYVDGKIVTYKIKYQLQRSLNQFEDHDEVYWNVTGNGWDTAILKASATVKLPSPVDEKNLKSICYTGLSDSKEQDCEAKIIDGQTYQFSTNHLLPTNAGLTIVSAFPKKLINYPSPITYIFWFLTDNWGYWVPIFIFLFLYYRWYKYGRDPKATHPTIMPEYEAPDGLRPAEIGTLIDDKVDMHDITSTIIDLATRGWLKIIETEKKGLFGASFHYELEQINPDTIKGILNDYEQIIFDGIFGSRQKISLDDLKNTFYTVIPIIQSSLYKSLVEKKYYASDPDKSRNSYYAIAISGFFISLFFLGFLIDINLSLYLGLLISFLIIGIFGRYMPKKTQLGADTYIHILGLEEFIKTAEKDRLKFYEKENIFEKILPYAIALGLADKWAKACDGLMKQSPDWYQSSNPNFINNFSTFYFLSALNNFNNTMSTNMNTAPRSSSSSGSSGFGGGGFSGGGFGGGGGGSW